MGTRTFIFLSGKLLYFFLGLCGYSDKFPKRFCSSCGMECPSTAIFCHVFWYFQQCTCVNAIYFAPVVTKAYRMKNNKSSTRGLSLEMSVLAKARAQLLNSSTLVHTWEYHMEKISRRLLKYWGKSFGTTLWHHIQTYCCLGVLFAHAQVLSNTSSYHIRGNEINCVGSSEYMSVFTSSTRASFLHLRADQSFSWLIRTSTPKSTVL